MSTGLPFSHDPHKYNDIINEEECEFLNPLDPLDDSRSLPYQELEILQSPAATLAQIIATNEATASNNMTTAVNVEQQQFAQERGLKSMKISSPNYSKSIKRKENMSNKGAAINKQVINASAEEERPACSSAAKKMDHNAKEKIRRMKLNASFLALRALLPDSTRSKKRWSAPCIVDRVLKYIPELENEVENLKSKKENVVEYLSSAAADKNNKINANIEDDDDRSSKGDTVSVTKVNEEEAIIQICMAIKEDGHGLAFTSLLQHVEDEGMRIKSASWNCVCQTRICYHLHIQVDQTSSEAHYIEELRDRAISWLRN